MLLPEMLLMFHSFKYSLPIYSSQTRLLPLGGDGREGVTPL